MYKFLPKSGFRWIDPKEFDLNNYTSNSSKGFVPEVDLEYPKKLPELHKDYHLAPYKIEIKREMIFDYQLKFGDLQNIPIGNVKKLVPNIFRKEKYVLHYENLQLYLRLRLKLKKNRSRTRIQQSQWFKLYIEFNTHRRTDTEKKTMTKMQKHSIN